MPPSFVLPVMVACSADDEYVFGIRVQFKRQVQCLFVTLHIHDACGAGS